MAYRSCAWMGLLLSMGIASPAQQTIIQKQLPTNSQSRTAKISPPELIQGDRAEYPDDARIRQVDGLCSLSLVVGVQGDPRDVHVIHCTDPSFEDSSVNAVSQYRFRPALTQDGKPVAVTLAPLVLQYHVAHYGLTLHMLINPALVPDRNLIVFDRKMSRADIYRELGLLIHSDFVVQQGLKPDPAPDGTYPLTISATAPRVIWFSDKNYPAMAFVHDGNSACDVMITIDTNGRASDPKVLRCERPELETPAVKFLLTATYRPGYVSGRQVPIRAAVHLYYGDDPSILSQATN